MKLKALIRQTTIAPFVAVLWLWHHGVSPLFGQCCRFSPSCSEYATEALKRHGLLKGGFLAMKRVIRCSPLFEGGNDPVPE